MRSMSKAVLLSVQPKWCELIASGKKTLEVRKTKTKFDKPFKCYIYCTRYEKGKLIWKKGNKFLGYKLTDVSGKVIGEFVCDKIYSLYPCDSGWVKEHTCLSQDDFFDYLGIPRGTHFGYGKVAYGWHISNLVIYDEPKELSNFYRRCDEGCEACTFWKKMHVNADELDMDCSAPIYGHIPITRPPQSWCYVEDCCYE